VGGAEEHASLTGSIRFPAEGSPEIEGALSLEHFPLSRSRVASMDVLGEVRLKGTLARPVVRGRVAIEEARIGVPAADDPILKEILVARGSMNGGLTEAPPGEREPFDGAHVDVEFRVPGSTRVRGQGANLFVEGDARVVKLPGEDVRIRGEARVVNGTYTFQGRRFQVRRGRVLLTGDQRLDPVLDVEARLPVAEIVAIVEISGRLSSPVVRLRSEPPRSDQDVLAYLLFGRPADEVGAAGGTRFEAAAARLVAGVAERELREVLGDAMPVDAIEIGADAEGNTSELGFGKYLSRNLYLRYVRVLGDEPADRVGAEYRLNDNFSIGSSVSTTGEAGLDLILRHDF
jgi:translocation and assembly module TamB